MEPGGWVHEGLAGLLSKHCYAERVSKRIGKEFTKVVLHPERLDQPLHWRKPRRIFVNSMSDLFHEQIPDEFLNWVFAVMASAGQHTFQVLTKRAGRMNAYFQRVSALGPDAGKRYENEMRAHFERDKKEFTEGYSLPRPPTPELRLIYDSAAQQEKRPTFPDGTLRAGFSGGEYHWRPWPLSNVWLGVSVESADQLWRIERLLQTPAAVRFVSLEPLLGPIDVSRYLRCSQSCPEWAEHGHNHTSLDWVIAGGESGGRPERALVEYNGLGEYRVKDHGPLEWLRSIRDQCTAAGVPFFLKQLGGPRPKSGGRLLDGREWNEYPEVRR